MSDTALPQDVAQFMASVAHKTRHADALVVIKMMQEVTGLAPKMWGASLIGFDSYHYTYDSGREGDSFMVGLSPRKAKLVIYIMPGFSDYTEMLERLGKFKSSVSCLYINKLADVDQEVLREIIARSYQDVNVKYPKV